MTTPAITQVQNALKALLVGGTSFNVIVDRASGEPIEAAERPAIIILQGEDTIENFDQSTDEHTVNFDLEIYEDVTQSASISSLQARAVATINAVIGTDKFLGNRLQDLRKLSVSPPSANAPDLGAITFTLQAVYLTPRWDYNTIIGQSGLFT